MELWVEQRRRRAGLTLKETADSVEVVVMVGTRVGLEPDMRVETEVTLTAQRVDLLVGAVEQRTVTCLVPLLTRTRRKTGI